MKVDDLAQEIRRVDGDHSLGAGALAEALMPFIDAHLARGERDGEVVAWRWQTIAKGVESPWRTTTDKSVVDQLIKEPAVYRVHPLYAHPAPSQAVGMVDAKNEQAVGYGVDMEDLCTATNSVLTWLETLAQGRELRPDADVHAFHPEPDKTKFRKVGIARAKANASAFVPVMRKLYRMVRDLQDTPRPAVATAGDGVTDDPAAHVLRKIAERVEHFRRVGKAGGQYTDGRRHEAQLILDLCTAALASPSAPRVAVPEGWKLVPVEPTPKMIDATFDDPIETNGQCESHNTRNRRVYKAMLAAAPEVPRG